MPTSAAPAARIPNRIRWNWSRMVGLLGGCVIAATRRRDGYPSLTRAAVAGSPPARVPELPVGDALRSDDVRRVRAGHESEQPRRSHEEVTEPERGSERVRGLPARERLVVDDVVDTRRRGERGEDRARG